MCSKESSEMTAKLHKAFEEKTITKLQHDVYIHLLRIPHGKVTTYKHIADAVKCNSAQAIGQALRKNPFAPAVPCHRVIRSDQTLGGFSGSTNNETVDRKMGLLQSEGVKFSDAVENQSSQAKVKLESVWAG